jgi:hypothetical protein
MTMHSKVMLQTLVTWDGVDPAVMLALVGRQLQNGLITCDLTRLIGMDSMLERRPA